MKILFLSQHVPEPPNKGDKIRAHHLMKRLAARHTVHVACLVDEPAEAVRAGEARRWAASVTWRLRRPAESVTRAAAALLSGEPLSVGFFRSRTLAEDVRGLLARERFDLVVAYCSSMAAYAEAFRGPKVLDLVDVDSEKWRQYAERTRLPRRTVYALEHRRMRAYEAHLVRSFDRCILVSSWEKECLGRFADPSRVEVVANGVDADWFAPRRARPSSADLVFVGALDCFANAEGITAFARDVFPEVRRQVRGARLRIVGRKPGAETLALGAQEGVHVVGEVEDVRPELWRAAIAVVPLRIAQGLQNKVLEAMAAGVPVVTSRVAARGIEGRAGEDFLVADEPAEWVRAIASLAESRQRAQHLAANALRLVHERYSWDRKADEYEAVLEAAGGVRRELAGALA